MSTRASRAVLSSMRYLLRHARTHCGDRGGAGAGADAGAGAGAGAPASANAGVRETSAFISAQFREGARTRDRAQTRVLRSHASELVAYLRALEDQKVRTVGVVPSASCCGATFPALSVRWLC